MCGIVGLISIDGATNAHEKMKFFSQGLFADELRGNNATGVMYSYTKPASPAQQNIGYLKQGAAASVFMQEDSFQKILVDTDEYKFLVGHNRYATMGAKHSTDNAHPFQEGPITLVHNGGLTTSHGLPIPMYKLNNDGKGVEVDSHVICHNLALHPAEEVIGALHGAFALVWYDSRDDSMNIVRNAKRPLAMAYSANGRTIYFASEGTMLAWLAARNDILLKDIMQPRPGRWLKFMPEDMMNPIIKDVALHQEHMGWQQGMEGHNYPFGAQAGRTNVVPFVHRPAVIYQGEKVAKSVSVPDTVGIGGRQIPIPKLLQSVMLEYDVHPMDTYAFTPDHADHIDVNGRFYGRVTGLLDDGELAVLYNVPVQVWQNRRDHDWIVSIIGVLEFESAQGDEHQEFICRHIKYVVPNDYKFVRTSDEDVVDVDFEEIDETPFDMGVDERSQSILDALDEGYLPGPGGVAVSAAVWKEMVSKGCALCEAKLYPRMAENIVWMSEGYPVCEECIMEERAMMRGESHWNQ